MRIEDTIGSLRELADHLFEFIARPTLAGVRPELQSWKHCYKVEKEGHRAFYLEIVGPRGRKRQNAVKLNTAWDASLGQVSERVVDGNGLHGAPAAELWVRAGESADIALAEEFIRRALSD